MRIPFISHFLRLIRAEIRKAFRKRRSKRLFLISLFLIVLTTGTVFFLRWTKRGSRMVEGFISKNPKIVYQLKKILKIYDLPYLIYSFSPSKLPKYELIISDKNLEKLNENLPKRDLLTDEYKKSVKAKFKHGDKEYSVEVRFRGDKREHWLFDKKSWRINFKKDYFEGKKSINLIIPEDRGYLNEALSFYIAKKMGLFTLENEFVELYINGRYEGVYFLVEHWGSQVIEKNKLISDTNLYGEATFDVFPANIYSDVKYFQKYVSFSGLPEDNFDDLKILLDYLNNLPDDLFYQKIGDILDIENFLTWQAHSALFFSHTSNCNHNVNLIFNREKGKFQFIPWDIGAKDPAAYEMEADYNPLVKRILGNPYFLCQRNKILLSYVGDKKYLKDDLDFLKNLYQKTRFSFYRDHKKNFLNPDFDFRVKENIKWPVDARKKIKQELANTDEICRQAERPKDSSLETFSRNYPIFKKKSENEFILTAGSYFVYKDIIVPKEIEITIEPGAKLFFDQDISFISYGKLKAIGLPNNKIVFSSISSNPWGVLALVEKDASGSIFSNIILENASSVSLNNITFAGGLAAHYTDVLVEDSIFRFNHGDDAINVKHAKGVVKNCLFSDNQFDSVDFDDADGEISNNTILSSGNDGIDLGSANPLVFANLIKSSGDKGISIGELSKPEIKANLIENSNIGIAVKDSSQPKIFKNYILKNGVGLSSYQKKPFFIRKQFEFFNNWFFNNKINWELKDGVAKEKDNFIDQKPKTELPPFD